MAQTDFSAITRALGPGLHAAQRLVDAAERAAAVGHTQLSWAELRQWPAWASDEPGSTAWLPVLGACWHATELQRCIDGTRLAALRDALGGDALKAVLQLDAGAPHPAPLLSPNDSAAQWLDQLTSDGRAIALASLPSAALREAVAAVLGWHERAAPLSAAHARQWLDLALHST